MLLVRFLGAARDIVVFGGFAFPAGVLTGLFFIFYAVFRIFSEHFREPDAEKFGMLTRGQFLSLFMIVGGVIFVTSHRWVKSKYPATTGAGKDPAAPPTSGS